MRQNKAQKGGRNLMSLPWKDSASVRKMALGFLSPPKSLLQLENMFLGAFCFPNSFFQTCPTLVILSHRKHHTCFWSEIGAGSRGVQSLVPQPGQTTLK